MAYLLSLEVIHSECNGKFEISAYDYRGNLLTVTQTINENTETISILVNMPNCIYIALSGKDYVTDVLYDENHNIIKSKSIELIGVSLAGIKFNKKDLEKIAVYCPDRTNLIKRTFEEYRQLNPTGSTHWSRNGCIDINLFDYDPFLFHLNVGTNIKY